MLGSMGYGDITVMIGGDITGLREAVEEGQQYLVGMGSYFSRVGQQMALMGRNMTIGITAPLALIAKSTLSVFSAFDEGMHNVATIDQSLQNSPARFKQRWSDVLDLSAEFGRDSSKMVKALYDINSASFKGSTGLTILKVSAMAATAGLATVDQAGKAISGILNAWGAEGKEAVQMAWDVGDMLFRTVEKGVLTFAELSAHLGATIASAAAAGIKFEEVAAAVATLTKQGINAAESLTSLNRLFLRLTQSSSKINEIFTDTKYKTAAVALESRGLLWVIQEIERKTGGTAVALQDYGLMVRDLKAGLALTSNEARSFIQQYKSIADPQERASAMMRAFNEQTKSVAFQLRKLRETWKAFSIEIWYAFKPAILEFIKALQSLVQAWRDVNIETKKNFVVLLGYAAALGPVLIIAGGLISTLGNLFIIGSMGGLAFLPVLLVVGGTLYTIYKTVDLLTRKVKGMGALDALRDFAFKDPGESVEDGTIHIFDEHTPQQIKEVMDFLNWIRQASLRLGLAGMIKPLLHGLEPVLDYLGSSIKNEWNNLIVPRWNMIKAWIGMAYSLLWTGIKALWEYASGMAKSIWKLFNVFDGKREGMTELFNIIGSLIATTFYTLERLAQDFIRGMANNIKVLANLIIDSIAKPLSGILSNLAKGQFKAAWKITTSWSSTFLDDWKEGMSNLTTGPKEGDLGAWQTQVGKDFSTPLARLSEWGDHLDRLVYGISDEIDALGEEKGAIIRQAFLEFKIKQKWLEQDPIMGAEEVKQREEEYKQNEANLLNILLKTLPDALVGAKDEWLSPWKSMWDWWFDEEHRIWDAPTMGERDAYKEKIDAIKKPPPEPEPELRFADAVLKGSMADYKANLANLAEKGMDPQNKTAKNTARLVKLAQEAGLTFKVIKEKLTAKQPLVGA